MVQKTDVPSVSLLFELIVTVGGSVRRFGWSVICNFISLRKGGPWTGDPLVLFASIYTTSRHFHTGRDVFVVFTAPPLQLGASHKAS